MKYIVFCQYCGEELNRSSKGLATCFSCKNERLRGLWRNKEKYKRNKKEVCRSCEIILKNDKEYCDWCIERGFSTEKVLVAEESVG